MVYIIVILILHQVYEERMEMTGRQYEEFVINKDGLNAKQAKLVQELKAASQVVDLATRHVDDAEVCLWSIPTTEHG